MLYDLIIIGAGPAGLTAAIYAKRSLLKCLIFEKYLPGGKLNKTGEIDNYPGLFSIEGPEMAEKMTNHVKNYEIDWNYQEVIKLEKKEKKFVLETIAGNVFFSKTVIVASGAIEKELKIKGEKEFFNSGVSYCAICDGFLFRGKDVAVVGGGYSALEAALYMSNIARKVYLIHRSSDFRVDKEILEKAKNNSKIFFLLNVSLIEIKGNESLEKIIFKDNQRVKEIAISAVFPCIGLSPLSNLVHQLGVCDQQNYVKIGEDCSTSVLGLFAAGDVARINEKKIKQIVTAVAEGAVAAQSAIKYLKEN
ncbi:MAG: Thioredoxin reductase [Mycoplasmataceae bacterium]|nr:MAG: Thioredoxin reductase [Mycoplasmataceae bacterium]